MFRSTKGRSAGPVEIDGAKFMFYVGNEITHTNSRLVTAGSARRRSYAFRHRSVHEERARLTITGLLRVQLFTV